MLMRKCSNEWMLGIVCHKQNMSQQNTVIIKAGKREAVKWLSG